MLAGEAALVIDVGTGGVKCLLVGPTGKVLFKQTAQLRFRFDGGAADFDPAEVWLDICAMTRQAVRWAGGTRVSIVSVTSTSMREGNVFYGSDGKELLAVPNIDSRAAPEAEEIAARAGDLVYEKSGHWPNAMFLASRLRWISRKGGSKLARVKKVSMINDWVIFKFTGRLLSEPTNGCETSLFDIRRRSWSGEVARELAVDEDLLPDVAEGGTVVGNLSREASGKTSLSASVVVTVGAADTEAALAGCGAIHEGQVVAVAGTTTPVQAVVDSPATDPKRRTWTCCHVVPRKWLVESNAGATGMLFDWWSRMTGMSYGELDKGASKLQPGADGVRVVAGAALFNARRFPPLRTRIENIGPWTEPYAVAMALIENACYAVRANLEQIEGITGESYREVRFCGGSAKSSFWSRVQADVLKMEVLRFKVGDATARGAAMLSFVGLGRFRDISEAAGKMAKDSVTVRPSAADAAAYGPLYGSWLSEAIPAEPVPDA